MVDNILILLMLFGIWTRRFTANINNISTLVNQTLRLLNSISNIKMLSTIRKRVRRYILMEFETIDKEQIDDLMERKPMREAAAIIDSDVASTELHRDNTHKFIFKRDRFGIWTRRFTANINTSTQLRYKYTCSITI
jgi:hypothetical protein